MLGDIWLETEEGPKQIGRMLRQVRKHPLRFIEVNIGGASMLLPAHITGNPEECVKLDLDTLDVEGLLNKVHGYSKTLRHVLNLACVGGLTFRPADNSFLRCAYVTAVEDKQLKKQESRVVQKLDTEGMIRLQPGEYRNSVMTFVAPTEIGLYVDCLLSSGIAPLKAGEVRDANGRNTLLRVKVEYGIRLSRRYNLLRKWR